MQEAHRKRYIFPLEHARVVETTFFMGISSKVPEALGHVLLLELGHQASRRSAGGSAIWENLLRSDVANPGNSIAGSLFYRNVAFCMHTLFHQDLYSSPICNSKRWIQRETLRRDLRGCITAQPRGHGAAVRPRMQTHVCC